MGEKYKRFQDRLMNCYIVDKGPWEVEETNRLIIMTKIPSTFSTALLSVGLLVALEFLV